MKRLLALLFLLVCSSVFAFPQQLISDNFYPGVNCAGNGFDCGTSSDGVIVQNGIFNVTLSNDDGLSTMVCAVEISGANASAKTCIVRNGFTNVSCDSIGSVALGNHSAYYVCPFTNLSKCGWNGQNSIPLFGKDYPIDTSVLSSHNYVFVNHICNASPNVSAQGANTYFRVVNTKGVVCTGDAFSSVVFDSFGITNLGGLQSCTSGSFCDASKAANFSMTSNITGTFCVPGCHDKVKDGLETEVDYGGMVCGNCTPDGKASDSFYALSVEMQEGNTSVLSAGNPFDVGYCRVGTEAGESLTIATLLLLLVSGIVIGLLLVLIALPFGFLIIGITRYIRRKRKK